MTFIIHSCPIWLKITPLEADLSRSFFWKNALQFEQESNLKKMTFYFTGTATSEIYVSAMITGRTLYQS